MDENENGGGSRTTTLYASSCRSLLSCCCFIHTHAHTANTFDEKERYLSSVIQVLQNDPLLRTGTANLRAHVLRAQTRYEYGMLDDALRDVSEALATTTTFPMESSSLVGRAWRTQADCHVALQHVEEAEYALRQWAMCDPSCRTKAMKEIQALRESSSL